jgi:hypothetical protein
LQRPQAFLAAKLAAQLAAQVAAQLENVFRHRKKQGRSRPIFVNIHIKTQRKWQSIEKRCSNAYCQQRET